MTINKDIELEGQQAIPSHPANPAAHSDEVKVVGEEVLQTPGSAASPVDLMAPSEGGAL